MTADPQVTPPSERPGTEYTERLATRIPPDIDERLRLMAVLSRKPLQHVLAAVLARALPTADDLARQIKGDRTDER